VCAGRLRRSRASCWHLGVRHGTDERVAPTPTPPQRQRLEPCAEILLSAFAGADLARALTQVELGYRVRLLYGTRKFGELEHEVLLVDARNVNPQSLDDFKFHLWERYAIDSYRYQPYPEYNHYLRAGTLECDRLSGWWTDAGTFESLRRAGILVAKTARTRGESEDELAESSVAS